jgi:hypothetical protein
VENTPDRDEIRGWASLTRMVAGRSVGSDPEGPDDTNGGDDLDAHVSVRFLRVLACPAG